MEPAWRVPGGVLSGEAIESIEFTHRGRQPSKMTNADSRVTYRFRNLELDVAAYELRRRGRPIRLERQPMDLLILLVERSGMLVSRAEIVDRLWGKDVFLDVDTGVHTAIRKIRQALRDSPAAPVFIETVTGKGYRFIADVEVTSVVRDLRPRALLGD